jgi:hypothetical protein
LYLLISTLYGLSVYISMKSGYYVSMKSRKRSIHPSQQFDRFLLQPLQIRGNTSMKLIYGKVKGKPRNVNTKNGECSVVDHPRPSSREASAMFRHSLFSLLLSPFSIESATSFSHALLITSPSQKPACGFPAQASSFGHYQTGISDTIRPGFGSGYFSK